MGEDSDQDWGWLVDVVLHNDNLDPHTTREILAMLLAQTRRKTIEVQQLREQLAACRAAAAQIAVTKARRGALVESPDTEALRAQGRITGDRLSPRPGDAEGSR